MTRGSKLAAVAVGSGLLATSMSLAHHKDGWINEMTRPKRGLLAGETPEKVITA